MNRTDYSRDVALLPYEVDDWDTVSFKEEGSHPTGINDGRMRLPTRYDISKYYKRLVRNREQGNWKRRSEELVDFGGSDFDWQITYSFPETRRDPVTTNGHVYGGLNVTYRRLYLILCEHFNEGRFFIDDYFKEVYPHTVKPEIDDRLNRIKQDLLDYADEEFQDAVVTKRGTFDKRYKVNRGMKARLKRYKAFATAWEENEGIYLANIIKEDIISCLMTGQIPLAVTTNMPSTDRKRILAGLSDEPRFFAMGRLIEHIQLFVKIGGTGNWQTKQGILV